MNQLVRIREGVEPASVPLLRDDFLSGLDGPTLFLRKGRDSSRVRIVSGLLHGNEPSGLHAVHRALAEPGTPAVDCVFFLGAVQAALAEPRHAHRMLPGHRDLNRCFGRPGDDVGARVAAEALDWLRARRAEAALDLHNNSGHNPAYSVLLQLDAARIGIAEIFAQVHVYTDFSMGTFMEALDPACPTVTVECGHAGDPRADDLAWRGVRDFLWHDELPTTDPKDANILSRPLRVTVAPGVSVAFGAEAPHASLLLSRDIDRHNFQTLEPGTLIGRLQNGTQAPLVARDAEGRDFSDELFARREDSLRVRRRLTPMMMTTNPDIAHSDCLFWAFVEGLG